MTTPLDTLVTALHDAASYSAAAEAPPEVMVWCDGWNYHAIQIPTDNAL